MSSCAASCCTCSPKVSCASGTSASWPTANVPPPCPFAFSCSAQHHKQKPQTLDMQILRDSAHQFYGCCCQPPPSALYSCTRLWYSVPRASASVSSAEKRDR